MTDQELEELRASIEFKSEELHRLRSVLHDELDRRAISQAKFKIGDVVMIDWGWIKPVKRQWLVLKVKAFGSGACYDCKSITKEGLLGKQKRTFYPGSFEKGEIVDTRLDLC